MLRNRLTDSIIWMGLNSFLKLALMIISFYLLSRVIDPKEFGKSALFVGFAGIITTTMRGVITQYVITKTNKNRSEINLLFCWATEFVLKFRLLVILGFTALFIIFAYYSILIPSIILQIWIITELISVSFKSICEGNFVFKKLVLLENGGYLVGYLLVAFVAGYKLELGYLSILLGLLGESLLLSFGYYFLSKPFNSGGTIGNKSEFKGTLSGMIPIRSLNYILSNIDYWYTGLIIGYRALGLYERSFKLINLPCNIMFNVIERVFFPHLAQKNSNSITNHLNHSGIIFLASSIIFYFYFLFSDDLVSLVNLILPANGKWDELLEIVYILSFLIPAKIVLKFIDTFLRARSELKLLTKLKALTLVSIIVSLILSQSLYDLSLFVSLAYNFCALLYLLVVAYCMNWHTFILPFLIPFCTYVFLNYANFYLFN